MWSKDRQRAEVEGNYEAFEKALPELMAQNPGGYAVYRHRALISVFDSFSSALTYCVSQYSDRLFSIQEISDEPLSLGWLSSDAHHGPLRSEGRAGHTD